MNWIKEIDKTWTLFLDRDGVLNHEITGDYVRSIDQLQLYEGVGKTIAKLNTIFGRIVIVTNQRCVGKEIITQQELSTIHQHLLSEINKQGGKIDKVYFAPALDDADINRKPNIGMALQAKNDFPEIDFAKSVMVGNSFSDMQFGKNADMKTVFVETTKKAEENWNVDMVASSFFIFTKFLVG
jgi:D-glycero-D-manno-heptose 1,7-bisphosphate phosphatase